MTIKNKKEQKLPLVYIKDDTLNGVQVKIFNGIHGYILATCQGYDSKERYHHATAMKVAEVIKVALQEAVDKKDDPLQTAPPVPQAEPCTATCPILEALRKGGLCGDK